MLFKKAYLYSYIIVCSIQKVKQFHEFFCDYEEMIPLEKQTASYIRAKQTELLNSWIPAKRQKQKPPSLLLELARSAVQPHKSSRKVIRTAI